MKEGKNDKPSQVIQTTLKSYKKKKKITTKTLKSYKKKKKITTRPKQWTIREKKERKVAQAKANHIPRGRHKVNQQRRRKRK